MSLAIVKDETAPAIDHTGHLYQLPAGAYAVVDIDGASPSIVYVTGPAGDLVGVDRNYVTIENPGTLTDYPTGEPIGPATAAQWLHAAQHADNVTGVFTVDRDGDPCPNAADPAVFGPLRTVFISGGPE